MPTIAQGYQGRTGLKATATSFMRTLAEPGVDCLLMGNAVRSGFETTAPDLASLMLDSAQAGWANTAHSADVTARLDVVFAEAERCLDSSPQEDDEDASGGWLTAVCVRGSDAFVQWTGGDEVWQLSGSSVCHRAAGHTFQRMTGSAALPNVLMRGMGGGYPESGMIEKLSEPWILRPGERLLILSRQIVAQLDEPQIIRAATTASVAEAARALTESVSSTSPRPYWAAIVFEL
jgi:hypothetical protein